MAKDMEGMMSEISTATRELERRGFTREEIVRAAKSLRASYANLSLEGALKMLLEDTGAQSAERRAASVYDLGAERRAATYQRRARALVKQARLWRDKARQIHRLYLLMCDDSREYRAECARLSADAAQLRAELAQERARHDAQDVAYNRVLAERDRLRTALIRWYRADGTPDFMAAEEDLVCLARALATPGEGA